MALEEGFDLTAQLEALSLDPDVYTAYVEGIMDEDGPLDERVESVIGILSSAVDGEAEGADAKLQAFGAGLGKYWEKKAADAAAAAAAGPSAEKQAEVQAFQARLEAEKRAAEQELQRQAEELAARCTQDGAALRGREALLNKYAYDTDAVDEEGNVVGGGGGEGGGADVALGAMLGANANKAAVADAARRQREQAKAAHAQKVARDKEALAKQLAKKEAEKRRTQKREKQRGCG